jgi:hypothetical protein
MGFLDHKWQGRHGPAIKGHQQISHSIELPIRNLAFDRFSQSELSLFRVIGTLIYRSNHFKHRDFVGQYSRG